MGNAKRQKSERELDKEARALIMIRWKHITSLLKSRYFKHDAAIRKDAETKDEQDEKREELHVKGT